MTRLASLGICLALLAGCLGGSTPTASVPSPSEDTISANGPAEVSDDRGGIEGKVIDSSLLPIAGAGVSLREPAADGAELQNITSALDGSFTFNLLAPGSYRLVASSPGYGNATQLVVVAAGEASKARLLLGEVASVEPYASLMIQAGLISCAFAVVVVSGVCLPAQTEPVFGPYNVALFFDVPKGHKAVVSENDWQNRAQVMRNWFFHDETRDANFEGDWLGDAIGPAVLRKEFFPGVVPSSFAPLQTETVPFPESDQNFTFLAVTYYDGQYQEEANSTGGPVCEANPIVGYCTGAGIALQTRFTQYLTVFVNEAPDSLAAYSAVPDQ